MHVLVQKDPIKNEVGRVFTKFLPIVSLSGFYRRSRAANSAVHGPIRLNLELSPDFMVVFVTCKNEEDSIKNEGASVHNIKH